MRLTYGEMQLIAAIENPGGMFSAPIHPGAAALELLRRGSIARIRVEGCEPLTPKQWLLHTRDGKIEVTQ